jgi:hypothetical protein
MLEIGADSGENCLRHATFDDSGGKQDEASIYAEYIVPQGYWEHFNYSEASMC